MIDFLPEGILFGRLIYEPDGETPCDIFCLYVNRAFELCGGFIVNSLQGQRLYELYPDRDKHDLFRCQEAIERNEALQYIRQGADGSAHEMNIYPQDGGLVFVVERDITEKAQAEAALKEAHETILSGIDYAGIIQKNLLPDKRLFERAFSDYSIVWSPRDVVGGDIYWLKRFNEGTVLCVCDCTGHGTPGALLTMLVVSAFEDFVREDNCKDTARIIYNLDRRLAAVLHSKRGGQDSSPDETSVIKDGCDLAVLFISSLGSVNISTGRVCVYICDGQNVRRIKGQKLFVGEGELRSKDDVVTVNIPQNPRNKFYIASDGLAEQPGGPFSIPFGHKAFESLVLQHHHELLEDITENICESFDSYRGDEPRVDDLQLIAFRP
jgi:hypothetical protein